MEWNDIIKSLRLYLMTQVLTSIYRNLLLFVAELISLDKILTPSLKEKIIYNKSFAFLLCLRGWFPGLNNRKPSASFNASTEM